MAYNLMHPPQMGVYGVANIGGNVQGHYGGAYYDNGYTQCRVCGSAYATRYGHVCPGPLHTQRSGFTITLTSKETTPMATATGKKPIVLQRARVEGEFDTQDAAIQEASRLAGKNDDEYVVYVPVAIVRPKKDVTVDLIPAAS